jgi:hypothetical protein
MRLLEIAAVLIPLAQLGLGQELRLAPGIAVAEAEYRDAQDAWLRNDPTLEKDLYKANPAEMRQRIHRAASLRDDVMVKKGVYLDLLAQRTRETRKLLGESSSAMVPAATIKKDLETQQMRILADQDRLDLLLHDLPQGDEYLLVRRALEGERADLINAQNSLALRIRSLDTIDKTQQATAGADEIAKKLEEIAKIWESERDRAARQRSAWNKLYDLMEQSLDKPGTEPAPRPAAAAKAPERPPAQTRTAAPAAARTTAPAEPQTALAGAWKYVSAPNAWSGYGEPEFVQLDLTAGPDGALRGSYWARLPVRNGKNEVVLTLKGQAPASATSARIHWTSATPAAEGEMEIKIASDGRMLLERVESNDSYVPRGMEVLLRR